MSKIKNAMKLKDLDKHNIYTVPDKYFDELPMRIQNRVNTKKKPWYSIDTPATILKYVVPAVFVLMIVTYFALNRGRGVTIDPEQIIAQVDNTDILAYLENSEISTDEIIEGYQQDNFDSLLDNALPEQALPIDDKGMRNIIQKYRLEIN